MASLRWPLENHLGCNLGLWHRYYNYPKCLERERDSMFIQSANPINMKEETSYSRCAATAEALLSAIFGVQDRALQKLQKLLIEDPFLNRDKLNRLWSIIQENENQLTNKPFSHFFAYSFSGIGHAFLVIQHKDQNNNIKYRILQSWVAAHNLNNYMIKRGNDLTVEEFRKFTEGFSGIFLNDKYSLEIEIFFKKYFIEYDKAFLSIDQRFEFQWGCSNLDAIHLHKATYDAFKESKLKFAMESYEKKSC